jgi:hypothetical protein
MNVHSGAPFPVCQHSCAGSLTEIQRQSSPRMFSSVCPNAILERMQQGGIVVYVVSKKKCAEGV